MYEGVAAKQHEAAAQKAAEEEKAANPKVQSAIGHAKDIVDRLKFDPSVTQAEVDAARKRLALAESGDYREYWKQYWPIMRERDAKVLAAANTVQEQANALAQRAKDIKASGEIPLDLLVELNAKEQAKAEPDANTLGLYQ